MTEFYLLHASLKLGCDHELAEGTQMDSLKLRNVNIPRVDSRSNSAIVQVLQVEETC